MSGRIGGERADQRIRHFTMGAAVVGLPADAQPDSLQTGEQLVERNQPDRVGVGHARSLRLAEGQALLDGEGEPPAGRERARYLLEQRLLVGKGEHRLEQEHCVERAGRDRGDARDLEAARKVAGALACDLDGAGAVVHPEVGATQFLGDEPSRPRDAAAQVEHRDPAGDAGLNSEGPDLAGAHEALLLDEFAGGERRHASSLQGLGERSALVLFHCCFTVTAFGREIRTALCPVLPQGRVNTEEVCERSRPRGNGGTVRTAQAGPLTGLIAQVLLLAALAETVGLGGAGWVAGVTCGVVTMRHSRSASPASAASGWARPIG